MSQDTWTNGSDAELADLAGRREELRQAAALPGSDPRALLDAAFAELDAAAEILAKLAEATASEPTAGGRPDALMAERALLRAVFQHAPVPLFVLEQDGTVRRANGRAGDLIGAPPGYATGKALTAFVDISSRAAVKSQLAAAARTGAARRLECRMLGPDGPVEVSLLAGVTTLQDGTRLLTVTADRQPDGPAKPGARAARREDPGPAVDTIRAMTRRMDMITAVTRLLLDNSTFSEAVTLQRCARQLAGDIASWVIVDVERAGLLHRQFVIGPNDEASQALARKARGIDPTPSSAPGQVHAAGTSVLLAHTEDTSILDAAPDGAPLLMLLGATSLLSVPITDGSAS